MSKSKEIELPKGALTPSQALSDLPKSDVMAIQCADVHLSKRPFLARSAEENWERAMQRPLFEAQMIAEQLQAPLLIAGDIFDKPEAPAWLINLAIKTFRYNHILTIPGQHDLPNHRMDKMDRSPYFTLCKAGKIKDVCAVLDGGEVYPISEKKWKGNEWYVEGFPWGKEPKKIGMVTDCFIIAMVHKYVWLSERNGFTGAPTSDNIVKVHPKFKGYWSLCFGDNHVGFKLSKKGNARPGIVNCGSLIRKNIDQRDYPASVWALMRDGNSKRIVLDSNKEDKFINSDELMNIADKAMEAADFIKSMVGLGKTVVNFVEAVKQYAKKYNLGEVVESFLEEAMEEQ